MINVKIEASEYDDAREAFKSGRIPPNFNGAGQGFNGGDFSDLFGPGGDIFSTLFGGARQRHGADLQTEASIGFKESIFGTELNLRLSPSVKPPTASKSKSLVSSNITPPTSGAATASSVTRLKST